MARADIDRRAMAALSSGHMAVDFAGGVLPALLPFLVTEWDLSYTYAGGLILASALAARWCSRCSGSGRTVAAPSGCFPQAWRSARSAWGSLRSRRATGGSSSSSSSPASAPPRTTRKARSSPPTRAVPGARAACRCSRSAATSATRWASSSRRRSWSLSGSRAVRSSSSRASWWRRSCCGSCRSSSRSCPIAVPGRGRPGETTAWARWRCCWASSPCAASPGSG